MQISLHGFFFFQRPEQNDIIIFAADLKKTGRLTVAASGQILKFSRKWLRIFEKASYAEIDYSGHQFPDDCRSCGFCPDHGQSLEEACSGAFEDVDVLDGIIDEAACIPMLGAAAFSKWQILGSRPHEFSKKEAEDSRIWFILVLSRLAELAVGQFFSSAPAKLVLVSRYPDADPVLQSGSELGQILELDVSGNVRLAYIVRRENEEKEEKPVYSVVSRSDAGLVFARVAKLFCPEADWESGAEDCEGRSGWTLSLISEDGDMIGMKGNLDASGCELSDFMRKTLGLENLAAFDGYDCFSDILRIDIKYSRKKEFETAAKETVFLCIEEQLIIDRASESIEHFQILGSGCRISRKYEIYGGVSQLLDDLYSHNLFEGAGEASSLTAAVPGDLREYSITAYFRQKPEKRISGSFGKDGLPPDYRSFIETVRSFMMAYGDGDIFSPFIYERRRRREGEVTYCSVSFCNDGPVYYYLTFDDTIEVGDTVIVPAGMQNSETAAVVCRIEHFRKEDVPYPLENVKSIIRKADALYI